MCKFYASINITWKENFILEKKSRSFTRWCPEKAVLRNFLQFKGSNPTPLSIKALGKAHLICLHCWPFVCFFRNFQDSLCADKPVKFSDVVKRIFSISQEFLWNITLKLLVIDLHFTIFPKCTPNNVYGCFFYVVIIALICSFIVSAILHWSFGKFKLIILWLHTFLNDLFITWKCKWLLY